MKGVREREREGWREGWMNGGVDEWMDGWADGWERGRKVGMDEYEYGNEIIMIKRIKLSISERMSTTNIICIIFANQTLHLFNLAFLLSNGPTNKQTTCTLRNALCYKIFIT